VRGPVVRGPKSTGQVREHLRRYARRLRRDQTDAERKLWSRLRDRRLSGVRFRRQHPIGPFIVDFCSIEANLVIELDGGQHALQARSDAARTEFLRRQGYRVLRFWDNEALANIDAVLQRIVEALGHPLPSVEKPISRPSPPQGERAG
jgi:very-short-patch-repair endonuclease